MEFKKFKKAAEIYAEIDLLKGNLFRLREVQTDHGMFIYFGNPRFNDDSKEISVKANMLREILEFTIKRTEDRLTELEQQFKEV